MTDPSMDATSEKNSRILNDYERLLDHVEELTESGEYDLEAIMPLRRSAEENWAVPEARSRLRRQPLEDNSHSSPDSDRRSGDGPTPETGSMGDRPSTLGGTSVEQSASPALSPPTIAQPPQAPIPTRGSRQDTRPDQAMESVPGLVFDEPPTPMEGATSRGVKTRRARKWVMILGVLFVVAAWLVPRAVYQKLLGTPNRINARFVLGSEPKAEVFRGESSLGETPLTLDADDVGEGLVLRREGFEPHPFVLNVPLDEDKVAHFVVNLEQSPIGLNWDGLQPKSQVSWDGSKIDVADFNETSPGTHRVRVVASGHPPVELTVKAAKPGEAGYQKALAVGREVERVLSEQPQLSISLSSKDAKAPSSASVVVKQASDSTGPFKSTIALTKKAPQKIFLPAVGTYLVTSDAGQSFLPFRQSVTLEKSGTKNLEIVFKKKPSAPVVHTKPPKPSNRTSPLPYYPPTQRSYRPPPVYHAPRPRGGGAGRIAPPSF